jgi:CcmD family protein
MSWLIVAYSIVWIAIFIYVVGLHRKQKTLVAELDELKSKLKE